MKVLKYILLASLVLFVGTWYFNHVNAWLGIGVYIAAVFYVAYVIEKKLNK